LETKLTGVRAKRANIVAEIIKREERGEHQKARVTEPAHDQQRAAIAMLNGSAQGRVPEPKKRRTYSEVIEERDVLDRAISIGSQLGEELKLKAQEELGASRADEFAALMRQKVQVAFWV
jgi:hypothetical protein